MNQKARIEKLEQSANPKQYLVVFEEDGAMWLGGDDVDYRSVLGGGDVEKITAEQLEKLEQVYNVILVSFVEHTEQPAI